MLATAGKLSIVTLGPLGGRWQIHDASEVEILEAQSRHAKAPCIEATRSA
jgi:hypothetical protein